MGGAARRCSSAAAGSWAPARRPRPACRALAGGGRAAGDADCWIGADARVRAGPRGCPRPGAWCPRPAPSHLRPRPRRRPRAREGGVTAQAHAVDADGEHQTRDYWCRRLRRKLDRVEQQAKSSTATRTRARPWPRPEQGRDKGEAKQAAHPAAGDTDGVGDAGAGRATVPVQPGEPAREGKRAGQGRHPRAGERGARLLAEPDGLRAAVLGAAAPRRLATRVGGWRRERALIAELARTLAAQARGRGPPARGGAGAERHASGAGARRGGGAARDAGGGAARAARLAAERAAVARYGGRRRRGGCRGTAAPAPPGHGGAGHAAPSGGAGQREAEEKQPAGRGSGARCGRRRGGRACGRPQDDEHAAPCTPRVRRRRRARALGVEARAAL